MKTVKIKFAGKWEGITPEQNTVCYWLKKNGYDIQVTDEPDYTANSILYALSQSELCVCDIASLLGMGQSAISHQLRILKQMRLVKFRREGKSVLYSLADSHIETILAQGMEHIGE